ncbi:MAG: FkbM family methyltransferase [Dysgonomonas sp.]
MATLKKKIKRFIYNILPYYIAEEFYSLKNQYFNNISFSQEGEDLVLNRFFERQKTGFYVDIGAHHPMRFSNTYKFYLKGWRGINVDAMPGSMDVFNKIRPNDINLEIAVSNKQQILTYYIFNEPALNTFSEEIAQEHSEINSYYRITDKIKIKTESLVNILDLHLPSNINIDFMSIDVEGLDLSVLQSNNWDKYRPKMLLVEALYSELDSLTTNEVYLYLKRLNYKLVAKTYNTMFFKDGNE